jgi:hypothetical protein
VIQGVGVQCKKTETDDSMSKEFLLHKDKNGRQKRCSKMKKNNEKNEQLNANKMYMP